jgi:hypothetical protein
MKELWAWPELFSLKGRQDVLRACQYLATTGAVGQGFHLKFSRPITASAVAETLRLSMMGARHTSLQL